MQADAEAAARPQRPRAARPQQRRSDAAAAGAAGGRRRSAAAATGSGAAAVAATRRGAAGGGGGGAGAGAEPAPIPPPSSRAGTAVNAAMSQLGVPYRFAAAEPGRRVRLLRPHDVGVGAGRRLPAAPVRRRSTAACRTSRQSTAQPGDLIFYYSPISHVGIYIGGGRWSTPRTPATSSRSPP